MNKTTYPHTKEIKALLEDKSELVYNEGLNHLIPCWERFANEYVDSEESIYEWLNDLDGRHIIDEILTTLSGSELIKIEAELKSLDELVITKTFEINECVWGAEIEIQHRYDRVKNWYYYRMNEMILDAEKDRYSRHK